MVAGGHDVHDPGRDVGLLGDQPTNPGGIPGRIGRGLQNHAVAHGQRRTKLVQNDLDRKVPRHDHSNHADGLLPDLSRAVTDSEGIGDAERSRPGELVDLGCRPTQSLAQRRVQLRSVGGQDRAPHLGNQFGAKFFSLPLERRLELLETPPAKGPIGAPLGFVERPTRRGNRPGHIGATAAGNQAQHLFGRGVHILEGRAAFGVDQLAVDEHTMLAHGWFPFFLCGDNLAGPGTF